MNCLYFYLFNEQMPARFVFLFFIFIFYFFMFYFLFFFIYQKLKTTLVFGISAIFEMFCSL